MSTQNISYEALLISTHNIHFCGEIRKKSVCSVRALREVWESETPKYCLRLPKINARKSGTPNF